MQRRDPKNNVDRIYFLGIGPTVLGQYCVIRGYGRRGSYVKFLAPLEFESKEEAKREALKLYKIRIAHGYRLHSVHRR